MGGSPRSVKLLEVTKQIPMDHGQPGQCRGRGRGTGHIKTSCSGAKPGAHRNEGRAGPASGVHGSIRGTFSLEWGPGALTSVSLPGSPCVMRTS